MKPRILPYSETLPSRAAHPWISPSWAFLILLMAAAWLPARAADPVPAAAPGFASVAEAQAAAAAAKAEAERVRQRYAVEEKACRDTFFATPCADDAKVRRNNDLTRIDEQQSQAELYIRREEARARHDKLVDENAKRDADEAARAASPRRQPEPADTAAGAPTGKPRSGAPAAAPERQVDDPAVRAENRARFERKQEEARDYASRQARDSADAEAQRASRRADREAEAARLQAERQRETSPAASPDTSARP